MSPAGSYMDWHIDMGGSSVWYHMVAGRKAFLVAPPTPANLLAYEAWAASPMQASVLDTCYTSGYLPGL